MAKFLKMQSDEKNNDNIGTSLYLNKREYDLNKGVLKQMNIIDHHEAPTYETNLKQMKY